MSEIQRHRSSDESLVPLHLLGLLVPIATALFLVIGAIGGENNEELGAMMLIAYIPLFVGGNFIILLITILTFFRAKETNSHARSLVYLYAVLNLMLDLLVLAASHLQ